MAEPCPQCDGDGYTERWNDDQSGVIITLCPDCGGIRSTVLTEREPGPKAEGE